MFTRLRSLDALPGVYLGVGLTTTRYPRPYQVTALFPYPNPRWGLTFFSRKLANRYVGPQPEAYPYRFVGFDQGSPFEKNPL